MRVAALSGGIGGARLVDGLAAVLRDDPAARLTVIANTGDDLDRFGLRICPDLDTLLYTLSGRADGERGWGLSGETFRAMEAARRLGGDEAAWFGLGDQDLGTHLVRTAWLGRGVRPTEVADRLARALGVPGHVRVLPMSDGDRPTRIGTADGRDLAFQDWLVREGAPPVAAVRFAADPPPTPEVLAALAEADLVVIPPSNPYVSVDPILTLHGVRDLVRGRPVVAVSPIVGGRAVRGPLAAMIPALEGGRPASAAAVAAHYGDLVTAWVVEVGDAAGIAGRVTEARTVMASPEDRRAVASAVLRAGVDCRP